MKEIFDFDGKQIHVDKIDIKQDEKEKTWMLGYWAQQLRSNDPESIQFPKKLLREVAENSGFKVREIERMLIALSEIEFHTEV